VQRRVAVVLCGGNIDTSVLGRCLERGLAADGRLCRFVVRVSDRPGGISELTRLIASIGVGYASIIGISIIFNPNPNPSYPNPNPNPSPYSNPNPNEPLL
jgi:hypothetical protein